MVLDNGLSIFLVSSIKKELLVFFRSRKACQRANVKKVVTIIHVIAGTNEFSTCKSTASVT